MILSPLIGSHASPINTLDRPLNSAGGQELFSYMFDQAVYTEALKQEMAFWSQYLCLATSTLTCPLFGRHVP